MLRIAKTLLKKKNKVLLGKGWDLPSETSQPPKRVVLG